MSDPYKYADIEQELEVYHQFEKLADDADDVVLTDFGIEEYDPDNPPLTQIRPNDEVTSHAKFDMAKVDLNSCLARNQLVECRVLDAVLSATMKTWNYLGRTYLQ